MALTKVTGGVVSPSSDYAINNVTGVAATFTGNVSIGGTLTYQDVSNIDAVGIITAQKGIQITGDGLNVTGISTFNNGVGIADSIFHIGDIGTFMKFNTDEIVFETGATSKVFINDEGDLTVGASEGNLGKIYIKQAADTDTEGLTLLNSGASNSFRLFLGDTSGAVAHFGHGGQKQFNITQAGKIGIGTTNPDSGQLQVIGNGYHQINISANKNANANKLSGISFLNYEGDKTSVFQTYASNSSNSIYYGSADNTSRGVQYHNFYVNTSRTATTNHALALRIDSSGHITPGTDNSQNIGDGSKNFASIWASTRFRGNDNVKLVLGNSQNLVIRHDGSNNIIGSPVADDLHIKSGTGDNDNQLIASFKHSDGSVGIGTTNVNTSNGAVGRKFGIFSSQNNVLVSETTSSSHGFLIEGRRTGRDTNKPRYAQIGLQQDDNGDGIIKFSTAADSADVTERLRIQANGDVELSGVTSGVTSCLWDASANTLIFNDNVKAAFGNGSDVTLYHTGTNSYIHGGANAGLLQMKNEGGNIDLMAWNKVLIRVNAGENAVVCNHNNSVDLYYNADVYTTPKLKTSATGVIVHGEVAASQDYPNIRPALDFNFAATKKLDSRFRYYRLGGASYIDENGLVKFVSENQPRFDHDPVTREPKGLLIEQTRTNLLRYSHGDGFKSQGAMGDYTVGWVQQSTSNSTITQNAALGPDGTMSALKYTLNATSGRRLDYEEVDLDNSTTYCWSWWMKRMAADAVWSFQFVSGTSPTGDQILIDGVEASGQTTTYTPPDDKWHRVTWKFTTQANADEQDIGGYDSSGSTGDRWLLWGAQLEAGSFATSLIPTRGNKATRGSEEIHMGSDRDGSSALDRTILNIFDDYEGTIVAEWETKESETNQNLISFHKDLSGNERVELRATGSSTANARAEVVTGGSSTVSIQVAHSGIGKNTKAAFGFQKDNYSLSVNGSDVSSDTSGNFPSDINSLMIGKGTWGTYFDGHLKRFMYYPKNLPDSQLITLTS